MVIFRIRPCVQSGTCCKRSVCTFGTWDEDAHQCAHLKTVTQTPLFVRYSCGIKAEIDALPPSAGAIWNPAFGSGCCAPLFNENREAILRYGSNHHPIKDSVYMTDTELAIMRHVTRICGKNTITPRLAALGILKRLGEPVNDTIDEMELEEKLSVLPDNALDDWRSPE